MQVFLGSQLLKAPVSQQLEMISSEQIRSLLPANYNSVVVRTWRTFLYREPGISVKGITHHAATPMIPAKLEHHLPPEAYDIGKLKKMFFSSPEFDDCEEFWIGADHEYADKQGYVTELTAEYGNVLFAVLTWLGLIGFVLSVLNFAKAWFNWPW
jgi:hypothetical protein